jgi:ABC-2 type transport system ATP-binding protein
MYGSATMLEARDLTKRFADGTLALDTLNLRVEAGELYCLLGANGAGKTTAIHLFLGFLKPTAGRAMLGGLDVLKHPLECKRKLAYLPENLALYESLTARQNLAFFARLGGRRRLDREDLDLALRRVGLPERTFSRRVHTFSKGMRQKLGIAIALLKEASVLLLDEPMAGLDPRAAEEFMESLERLRDQGAAILLSTHDLFHARRLADQVGILKEGRQVLTVRRAELETEDLEKIYLDYMRGEPAAG